MDQSPLNNVCCGADETAMEKVPNCLQRFDCRDNEFDETWVIESKNARVMGAFAKKII